MFKENGRVSVKHEGQIDGFYATSDGDVAIIVDGIKFILYNKDLAHEFKNAIGESVKVEGYMKNGVVCASYIEKV